MTMQLKYVFPINAAARKTGVSATSISKARREGELTQHELGDGSPVVDLREVKKRWKNGGQAGKGRPANSSKK